MTQTILSERLAEARLQKGYTQQQIAEFLGCNRATVTNYENGKRTPDIDTIVKLAKLYEVSADYLLGLSNAESTDKDIQFISKRTGLNENAINRLAWYNESGIFEGSCISYTEIINRIIESKTIDDICEYIDEYACSIKKEKALLTKMVEMFNNNDYPKSPEQCEMIDIEDSRDLSLFRVQEIIKAFTKELCSETLKEIKILDTIIEQRYNELHSEGD